MREHKRQLRLMLKAWRPVAWTVRELGGCIAWEWPRDCALWKSSEIQDILQEYGLEHARFDGCSYGVKCQAGRFKGLPIRKPWSIVTDCPALWRRFSGKCCPGPGAHPYHAPCAGSDTAASGYYTRRMAVDIHKSWMEHCTQRRFNASAPAVISAGELCVECDARGDEESRVDNLVANLVDESGSTPPSGSVPSFPGGDVVPRGSATSVAPSGCDGNGSRPAEPVGSSSHNDVESDEISPRPRLVEST